MSSKPRDRLIETALRLFLANGFHATGIDRILADAGVAKMTLYRHFQSKDALILAALDHHQKLVAPWMEAVLDAAGPVPESRVRALFDALALWFEGRGGPLGVPFRGCIYINAVAEFGDSDHPVHRAASQHLRTLSTALSMALRDSGLPRALTHRLEVVITGAVVVVQAHGDPTIFREAREIALMVMSEARHGTVMA